MFNLKNIESLYQLLRTYNFIILDFQSVIIWLKFNLYLKFYIFICNRNIGREYLKWCVFWSLWKKGWQLWIDVNDKRIGFLWWRSQRKEKAEVDFRFNWEICNEVNHLCLLVWSGLLETSLLINFSDKLLAWQDQRRHSITLLLRFFYSSRTFAPFRSSNRGV